MRKNLKYPPLTPVFKCWLTGMLVNCPIPVVAVVAVVAVVVVAVVVVVVEVVVVVVSPSHHQHAPPPLDQRDGGDHQQ